MYVPHIGILYPVLVNTDASCDSNNLVYIINMYVVLEDELYLEQPEWFIIAGREKEVCHLPEPVSSMSSY